MEKTVRILQLAFGLAVLALSLAILSPNPSEAKTKSSGKVKSALHGPTTQSDSPAEPQQAALKLPEVFPVLPDNAEPGNCNRAPGVVFVGLLLTKAGWWFGYDYLGGLINEWDDANQSQRVLDQLKKESEETEPIECPDLRPEEPGRRPSCSKSAEELEPIPSPVITATPPSGTTSLSPNSPTGQLVTFKVQAISPNGRILNRYYWQIVRLDKDNTENPGLYATGKITYYPSYDVVLPKPGTYRLGLQVWDECGVQGDAYMKDNPYVIMTKCSIDTGDLGIPQPSGRGKDILPTSPSDSNGLGPGPYDINGPAEKERLENQDNCKDPPEEEPQKDPACPEEEVIDDPPFTSNIKVDPEGIKLYPEDNPDTKDIDENKADTTVTVNAGDQDGPVPRADYTVLGPYKDTGKLNGVLDEEDVEAQGDDFIPPAAPNQKDPVSYSEIPDGKTFTSGQGKEDPGDTGETDNEFPFSFTIPFEKLYKGQVNFFVVFSEATNRNCGGKPSGEKPQVDGATWAVHASGDTKPWIGRNRVNPPSETQPGVDVRANQYQTSWFYIDEQGDHDPDNTNQELSAYFYIYRQGILLDRVKATYSKGEGWKGYFNFDQADFYGIVWALYDPEGNPNSDMPWALSVNDSHADFKDDDYIVCGRNPTYGEMCEDGVGVAGP